MYNNENFKRLLQLAEYELFICKDGKNSPKSLYQQIIEQQNMITNEEAILANNLSKVSNSITNIWSQDDIHTRFMPGNLFTYDKFNRIVIYPLYYNYDKSPILVVKTLPIIIKDYEEFIEKNEKKYTKNYRRQNHHESLIAMLINKHILPFCANFLYSYGVSLSPPAYIKYDNSRQLSLFSNTKNKVENESFIYYEYVGSKNLPTYIRDRLFTMQSFNNVWYQILYSLLYMQTNFSFTHYDLHISNIMIQEMENDITLKYHIDDKDIYLTTNLLVKIIDPAFAHIKIKNTSYCVNNLEYMLNGKSNVFNTFADIYLLLMTLTSYIRNKTDIAVNKDIFNFCTSMIKFFNDVDDIQSIIDEQECFFYPFFLPAEYEESLSLSLIDFIKYSEKILPPIIDYATSNNLYSINCEENINKLLTNRVFQIDFWIDYQSQKLQQLTNAISSYTDSNISSELLLAIKIYCQVKKNKNYNFDESLVPIIKCLNLWFQHHKQLLKTELLVSKKFYNNKLLDNLTNYAKSI